MYKKTKKQKVLLPPLLPPSFCSFFAVIILLFVFSLMLQVMYVSLFVLYVHSRTTNKIKFLFKKKEFQLPFPWVAYMPPTC